MNQVYLNPDNDNLPVYITGIYALWPYFIIYDEGGILRITTKKRFHRQYVPLEDLEDDSQKKEDFTPLEIAERRVYDTWLLKNRYNKNRTRKDLGVTINTLNAKIQKYSIVIPPKKTKNGASDKRKKIARRRPGVKQRFEGMDNFACAVAQLPAATKHECFISSKIKDDLDHAGLHLGDIELDQDDEEIIDKASENDWMVTPGDEMIKVLGRYNGQWVVHYSRIDMYRLATKYELDIIEAYFQ